MIRRLQIEPPKLALPLDKTQVCDNPATEESIAAEFKKLLEKARSGLSGARDEVAALGLALSQAVSTVKTQHMELKKTDDSVGGDLPEDASDDTAVMSDDESSGAGNGLWVSTERSMGRACSDTEVRDDTDESLDTQGDVSDGQNVEIDDSEGEISLDDDIVCTVLPDFADQTEVSGEDSAVSQDILQAGLKIADNSQGGTGFLSDSAKKGSGLTRVSLTESTEDESVEVDDSALEADVETTQISGDSGVLSSRSQPVNQGKQDNQTQVSEEPVSRDPEIERFLAQAAGSSDDSWDGTKGDGSLRSSLTGGDERGGIDYSRTGGVGKSEGSPWGSSSALDGLSKSGDQNKDLSVQLAMLRQAYEGLKAQTLGQSETRTRLVTGSVAGVGASSEAKHAENEAAPRGVRYLNKATAQRMMERIESALKEAARSRDGKTITLKLEPLQLGRVKCDVSLRDGALHARITPQNREVVHAVREHSHELQVALRRLGLNVERVTVQVQGEREVPTSFGAEQGLPDGKSFQGDGNNMPGRKSQHPEKTIGNDFADVTRATPMEAGITPADHWIA